MSHFSVMVFFIIEEVDDDGDYVDAIRALAAGYGFASFVYFCAFVVFFSVALYISPLSCGYVCRRVYFLATFLIGVIV